MNLIYRLLLCVVLFNIAVSLPLARASKPVLERSEEACQKLLLMGEQERVSPFSSSTLIPLNRLLGSDKCPFIPVMWREGDIYSKEFPSPGLVYMFSTAETAAEEIITNMNIKAVVPPYDLRDPIAAAAATLSLMLSEDPPRYIRNAILIRDGVIMVVPLLKRTVKKSAHTGRPIYIPLITKGHQELEKEDIFSAVFAAWALEPWLGAAPKTASIYLRPMAQRRTSTRAEMQRSVFTIRTEDYMPQVNIIYENFLNTAANQEIRNSMRPRRCSECATCPWASECRSRMKGTNDLSMMPLPPSQRESELLSALGYGNLSLLADLDINSDDFIKVSVTTGILPETLRYYISHALAAKLNSVLVTEQYQDPFAGLKRIVHIDFEDVLDHKIRSGVYLFGTEIQDAQNSKPNSRRRKFLKEEFIQADALEQTAIDDAWAEFLTFLKNDPELKGKSFLITTYSKHEQVKVEQEFDILKQVAEKFSRQQKASPYYSEVDRGPDKKPIGRLIRNRKFFNTYTHIKPSDVFMILDRSVDLLDYTRNNLAFPTYTNGIKKISPYVSTPDEQISYDEITGGLDSIKVALDRFQTGETTFMDMLISYNGKDINLNRLISDFIRKYADQPVYGKLKWTNAFTEVQSKVDEAVSIRRTVASLEDKRRLLEQILGRGLDTLNTDQQEELKSLLDRTDYLRERRNVLADDDLSDAERRAIQQVKKFELDSRRQALLFEFFKKMNPQESTKALAELFSEPSQFLTPGHISQILEIIELKAQMNRVPKLLRRSALERLALPQRLAKKIAALNASRETQRLWYGLYLLEAFGSPSLHSLIGNQ